MSDNVKLGLKVVAGAVALGVAYKGYKTMARSKSTGRIKTKQEVPVQPAEEVKDDIEVKLDEILTGVLYG